jgi:hypothetical protein
MLAFIIRIYPDARSSECQIFKIVLGYWQHNCLLVFLSDEIRWQYVWTKIWSSSGV